MNVSITNIDIYRTLVQLLSDGNRSLEAELKAIRVSTGGRASSSWSHGYTPTDVNATLVTDCGAEREIKLAASARYGFPDEDI